MADRYGGQNGMVGYTGGPYQYQTMDDNESLGDTARGAGSGAMSGAQMGTSIAPGVGTVIGGIVGGLAGTISGAFGSKKKHRREEAKRRAWVEAQQKLAKQRYQSRVFATRNINMSYSPANNMLAKMYGREGALDMSRSPWDSGSKPDYSPAGNAPTNPAGRTKQTARKSDARGTDRENSTPKPKAGQKPKVR